MLTFESIREIERAERDNKKLQKIPNNFFDMMRDYLEKKEKIKEKSSLDILELENAKNTIKRLVDIREKKVLGIAMASARTGITAENLTPEELILFDKTVNILRLFREHISEQMKKKPLQTVYKVKKSIPDFIGPDMKVYNLRENDLISMPKELADLLIKVDIIELVND